MGQLSPADYREYVLPYSRRSLEIARQAGVPIIHFGTNTGGMLDLIAEAGGDVIGVDWRLTLDEAWRKLGPGVAVQGNLDPVALLAPWDRAAEARAARCSMRPQRSGWPGHIFNLGHGILQGTPVDNVAGWSISSIDRPAQACETWIVAAIGADT